jgi:hypothetical protein
MKVARYEVPGSRDKQVPSRRERYDSVDGTFLTLLAVNMSGGMAQTVPPGRVPFLDHSRQ